MVTFTYIYHQYTLNVSIYTSTMDPMGIEDARDPIESQWITPVKSRGSYLRPSPHPTKQLPDPLESIDSSPGQSPWLPPTSCLSTPRGDRKRCCRGGFRGFRHRCWRGSPRAETFAPLLRGSNELQPNLAKQGHGLKVYKQNSSTFPI